MQLQKRRKTLVAVTVPWNVRNMSAAPQIPGQFEINLFDLSYSVVSIFNTLESYCLDREFGTLVIAAM